MPNQRVKNSPSSTIGKRTEAHMSKLARAALILATFAVVGRPLSAIYMATETAQVPVERLVANLERDLANDPKNVEKIVNLARLHAMAFSLKSPTLPATTLGNTNVELPWYGAGDNSTRMPSPVTTSPSKEATKTALEHLKQSMEYYERALTLDPNSLTAGLGRAWVLEQSGDKARAIAEYRRVIDLAWKTEQKATRARLGQRFFTEEASGYLIPLLNPKTDAAELAELRAR